MIPEILFWLSVAAMFHSYMLFPWLLKLFSKGKKENVLIYKPDENLPFVSIIVAVHNEAKVILKKICSIYNTLYPFHKFELLIGSDASTDDTNLICKICSENYDNLHFFPFEVRGGKSTIINRLAEHAKGDILILTDANVFFDNRTIFQLIKHFKNSDIDIVGGNVINDKINPGGISLQETAFISREIQLKYMEGLVWGMAMGVYGAVYAIRRNSLTKVPDNFLVDDFYITMNVLRKKGKVIMELNAFTMEDVPDDLIVEYKRKTRIAAGNFQNLRAFYQCLFPPWSSLAFVFFSHKVIRWTGPFLLIIIFITNLYLAFISDFFRYVLFVQIFLLILPFIDLFLRKINFHVIILRFITHFYVMNIAMMAGFFKSIFGKRSNIWQPTRR
jgi:cellulose synthase/poly-beta-1,6-N-acetylglucosamine synthase-like glycosyltransferase